MKTKLLLFVCLLLNFAAVSQNTMDSPEAKGEAIGRIVGQFVGYLIIPLVLILVGRRIRKNKMNKDAAN